MHRTAEYPVIPKQLCTTLISNCKASLPSRSRGTRWPLQNPYRSPHRTKLKIQRWTRNGGLRRPISNRNRNAKITRRAYPLVGRQQQCRHRQISRKGQEADYLCSIFSSIQCSCLRHDAARLINNVPGGRGSVRIIETDTNMINHPEASVKTNILYLPSTEQYVFNVQYDGLHDVPSFFCKPIYHFKISTAYGRGLYCQWWSCLIQTEAPMQWTSTSYHWEERLHEVEHIATNMNGEPRICERWRHRAFTHLYLRPIHMHLVWNSQKSCRRCIARNSVYRPVHTPNIPYSGQSHPLLFEASGNYVHKDVD